MIVVRPAEARDGDSLGEIHAAAWEAAYAPMFQPDFATCGVESRRGRWHQRLAGGTGSILVAELDGQRQALSLCLSSSTDRVSQRSTAAPRTPSHVVAVSLPHGHTTSATAAPSTSSNTGDPLGRADDRPEARDPTCPRRQAPGGRWGRPVTRTTSGRRGHVGWVPRVVEMIAAGGSRCGTDEGPLRYSVAGSVRLASTLR